MPPSFWRTVTIVEKFVKSEIGGIAATSSYVGILVRRQLEFFYLNSYDKPIGPAALHPKDRQSLVIQFMDRQTVKAYYRSFVS